MDLIRKEELASQVLAVIGADLHQPANDDILDILQRAAQRVQGQISLQASGIVQPQI
jgi:hypothetical protein